MASDTEGKNNDTTTVSKKAFNIFSALVTAAVGFGGVTVFNLAIDNARHTEQLAQLIKFGPDTGQRHTKRDDEKAMDKVYKDVDYLRQELQQLREAQSVHENQGAHNVANSRITRLEEEVRECCNHTSLWNGSGE